MPLIDKAKFLEYHEVDRMILPNGARVVAPGTKPELAPGNFIKLKVDSEAASEAFWAADRVHCDERVETSSLDFAFERLAGTFQGLHQSLDFAELLELRDVDLLLVLLCLCGSGLVESLGFGEQSGQFVLHSTCVCRWLKFSTIPKNR